jgi:hypothetical protein
MASALDRNRARDVKVFDKTAGYCHFCGAKLTFRNFGRHKRRRHWVIDHIDYKSVGGPSNVDNYLAACSRCNGLRWNRPGYQLQGLLLLGVLAAVEIRKASELGKGLQAIHARRKSWQSKWINGGCPRDES